MSWAYIVTVGAVGFLVQRGSRHSTRMQICFVSCRLPHSRMTMCLAKTEQEEQKKLKTNIEGVVAQPELCRTHLYVLGTGKVGKGGCSANSPKLLL